jgi:hypothetical protein
MCEVSETFATPQLLSFLPANMILLFAERCTSQVLYLLLAQKYRSTKIIKILLISPELPLYLKLNVSREVTSTEYYCVG